MMLNYLDYRTTVVLLGALLLLLLVAILWLQTRFRAEKLILETGFLSEKRELEQLWQARCHQMELQLQQQQTLALSFKHQKEEMMLEQSVAKKQIEQLLQMTAREAAQKTLLEKERQFLQETKEQLLKDFELAANKLYEHKQTQLSKLNKDSVEAVISPLKTQLLEFNKRIEDMVHKESGQRSQLIGQIVELQKQAHQLSAEANNLAHALKGDNKTQGSWGELILERLLEQSGLVLGREYEKQQSYTNEDGRKLKPDVIVHLPDGKDIVIDSKVSLVAYEKYANADDEEQRSAALSAHLDSIKNHIRGLSLKNYEGLQGLRTLDFVFMFVPLEAAYLAAVNSHPELFREAYDKSIVIVSPSSLMVALKTVETIWRHEKQNLNAEKIAISAGRLYDQFVLMIEAFDDIGSCLNKTQDAYARSKKRLAEGRGNLLVRVEQLKILGAKTSKKMPETFKPDAIDDNEHGEWCEDVNDDIADVESSESK